MAVFCDASFVGGAVRYKNLAGQSIVKERGDKTMAGTMLAYGSWNSYGSAAQDLGEGVKQVRAYAPNGKANAKVHSLMRDHVDDLTSREESLTPACAASCTKLADKLNPAGWHRMTEKSSAASMAISIDYIADPHSDSAVQGVLELITFLNVSGPLPEYARGT
jgi:hypothetical protein